MQQGINPMSNIKQFLHQQMEEYREDQPMINLTAADTLILLGSLQAVFKSDFKSKRYRARLEALHSRLVLASSCGLPVKLVNIRN